MYTTYTGKQVKLRPWRDTEELFSNAKAVHANVLPVLGPKWYTKGREISRMQGDGGMDPKHACAFAIEELVSDKVVGFEIAELAQDTPLSGEVGTFIQEPWRGRGFGLEAKQLALCFLFENFPLQRVGGFTMSTHARARRGFELLGMHCEGTMHGTYFSEGTKVGYAFYVIFREDWEQMEYRYTVKRGN